TSAATLAVRGRRWIGGTSISPASGSTTMPVGSSAAAKSATINNLARACSAPKRHSEAKPSATIFAAPRRSTGTNSTDVNRIATVTGRLGVAAGQWLVYAKAGWAGARVDVAGRDTVGPDSFSFDEWRNGWTSGAGLEYKVARNIGLGLEYSYIDLGS